MALSRRGVLLGAGAAGGLLLAWTLAPRRYVAPLPASAGEVAFDSWLKIGTDGVVTVAVPEAEMGHGITTLIPQIVAMELGADWRQIAVEPAPVSGAYGNAALAAHWAPLWLPLATCLADEPGDWLARRYAEDEVFDVMADGTTITAFEASVRAAAASARAMLAMAAANRWGVAWEECVAESGFIVHDKNRLSFAALAEDAARRTPPDPPVLRPEAPGERAGAVLPGAALSFPRLDLPAKVDGSYIFAGDVRLPDMVFAAIRHGPLGEARLAGYDPARARGVAGFRRVVEGPDWLAAVATTWWAAERALGLIAPRFSVDQRADSARIERALDTALRRGDATRIAERGNPDAWLSARFEHVARYAVAPALHATLETASATARLVEGRLELWMASQAPQAARKAAAEAAEVPLEKVVLYPTGGGGSFDRRLESDHAAEVALIARQVGKPVQLAWSRWQEHVAGLPRSPAQAVLAARTAPDGSLAALKVRVAMPGATAEFGERLFEGASRSDALAAQDEADPLFLAGAVPPYAIEHLTVEHCPARIALPTGRQRGNGAALGCFLIETFIDELAVRANREPLSYRIAMLGGDVKLVGVLQHAATLAEWNGGTMGSGQGLACCRMAVAGREGRIAVVASARRDERGIRVDRLTAVADIGRVINADIARQQIEGGLVFAMGLGSGCATAYSDGLPLTGRLGLLGLPLLADCPEIDVEFIDSEADPFDPGELGVAAALPAIANALYASGGTRVRSLPFLAETT
ncbi:isoquinoline 1-oxidoreductase beta subunit [Novosphingobium kunmingense]|uniref:Isoquinoline 1-oxidoreductase beta subunit n=1 Tax=Novosphingobium kunmingense TaxID=1211806 RepID=A0A2N0HK75_9SPHN|nr:molybdopterin cofactor-binding domain-containing protein [Novosphingobium kunmingense]PKB19353.1 isoquinoline 1-oxidoreductase beta subunit [Novosphingobium kunmingense]